MAFKKSMAVCIVTAWVLIFSAYGAGKMQITYDAPDNGFVTLVIEDLQGKRVNNLLGQWPVVKGTNSIEWNLNDVGTVTARRKFCDYVVPFYDECTSIETHVVKAGTYHVRGLFHKGIKAKLEFAVYTGSNKTSPWTNTGRTGGWLADHGAPAAIRYIAPNSGSPYSNEAHVLIGCTVGEAGDNFAAIKLDGTKIFGHWAGGWGPSWTADDPDAKSTWGAVDTKPNDQISDTKGNTYTIDHGQSVIKRTGSGGNLTIGTPGGPKLGLYDETRMNEPSGVAYIPENEPDSPYQHLECIDRRI
jgi:hypothetical protein